MTRDELIAAATELHDLEGCSCDRKYLMCCPNLVNAILRSGPAARARREQEADGCWPGRSRRARL
jgi:hypothetical protein